MQLRRWPRGLGHFGRDPVYARNERVSATRLTVVIGGNAAIAVGGGRPLNSRSRPHTGHRSAKALAAPNAGLLRTADLHARGVRGSAPTTSDVSCSSERKYATDPFCVLEAGQFAGTKRARRDSSRCRFPLMSQQPESMIDPNHR